MVQTRPVAPGTQDILSFNYHLAYIAPAGIRCHAGVVTGKKYERYALDALARKNRHPGRPFPHPAPAGDDRQRYGNLVGPRSSPAAG